MRTLPKLTVRVRFPSPAPNAKNVAAHANSTVSLKQVNAHSRPETALVPPRVPIGHLGECPWRLSVPKLTVRVRFPSPAPHAKSVAAEANRPLSLRRISTRPRQKTALVPLLRAH